MRFNDVEARWCAVSVRACDASASRVASGYVPCARVRLWRSSNLYAATLGACCVTASVLTSGIKLFARMRIFSRCYKGKDVGPLALGA